MKPGSPDYPEGAGDVRLFGAEERSGNGGCHRPGFGGRDTACSQIAEGAKERVSQLIAAGSRKRAVIWVRFGFHWKVCIQSPAAPQQLKRN